MDSNNSAEQNNDEAGSGVPCANSAVTPPEPTALPQVGGDVTTASSGVAATSGADNGGSSSSKQSVVVPSVLARVSSSCAAFVSSHGDLVSINDDAILSWAESIRVAGDGSGNSVTDIASSGPPGVPLSFDSTESAVNFWGILHLLAFGSGYRKDLHELAGRGAHETILFGMVSLHITGKAMDAAWMAGVKVSDVSEYFNFQVTKDEQIMPAVYKTVEGPLHPFAERIVRVLNETGVILAHYGYKTFGAFLMGLPPVTVDVGASAGDGAGAGAGVGAGAGAGSDTSDATVGQDARQGVVAPGGRTGVVEEKKDEPAGAPSAAALVSRLAATFPAFKDMYSVGDGGSDEVWILKNAQALPGQLYATFKDSVPQFNFSDINTLTGFADSTIPAILRKLGVLRVHADLSAAIDGGSEVENGSVEEVTLRAATVTALNSMCDALKSEDITPTSLSYYLWRLSKDGEYNELPRHCTPGTVFY